MDIGKCFFVSICAGKNKNLLSLHYFRLPKWAETVCNEYLDVLELFAAIKYKSFTHTTEGKKIKGGFIIKDIFDQLKNKTLSLKNETMGSSKPEKLTIYFTHGHAIVNVLNTLNVYEVNGESLLEYMTE